MIAQVIKLVNFKKISEADARDSVQQFLCSLKSNGQILPEYVPAASGRDFLLFVTTPKRDSLCERFDSVYVKNSREKLAAFFAISVSEIGKNMDCSEYCSCETRSAVEMQALAVDIDSVFTCCACGKPVALYELPCIDGQSDRYEVVNWQGNYRATDKLWLDSLNDRFTGKQLSDVNSPLNKLGREIADKVGREGGLKVYYNIFDDLTKKIKYENANGRISRVCPSCGKPMKYIRFCDGYERFICDECSLSSNIQPCRLD